MERENVKIMLGVHKHDARKFNEIIKDQIVSVTITSPPYFDLKDYGYKAQIGYGQSYQQYLEDLKTVFKNVYDCTKDSGTLWVIIDSFRSKNEVIPLPFDFSNCIKDIGWKLQEVIIWAKDRTVPWVHKGQMRNLFEYILLFSKSADYNFYIDEVRDFEALKKWWVKYPERYNPKGKTPSALWNFDIPTQGSWGNGYIKHFCPLPEEMIAQILRLTTKEGEIVLDPFAGSGAVLAKAENMNRKYIGFELNSSYIKMFEKYLKETGAQKRKEFTLNKSNSLPQVRFEKLILDLRVLKFARILYSKLSNKYRKNTYAIFVERKNKTKENKNIQCIGKFIFLLIGDVNVIKLGEEIQQVISSKPLSKFGIEAQIDFELNINNFRESLISKKLFIYTSKITHKFSRAIKKEELATKSKSEIIISHIKVELNENDYA